MAFVSYAQNLEDVLLWRALRQVKDGFYIDVGASDPTLDSVTRAFYERGWHGLNIEPLPAYHLRLCEERPRDINLAVAAGASDGAIELFDVPAVRGWATTDAALAAAHEAGGHEVVALTVPVRTLAAICAEHAAGEIHFLKIDAEGSEADVIRGMDLERWRPWILIVEAITPIHNIANHAEWEPGITEQGYRYAYFDGLNRYYVAAEHDDLRGALATQPNALDDFVSYGQASAIEAAQNSAVQAQEAEAQTRAAEAQTRAAEAQTRAAEAQTRAAEARTLVAQAEFAAIDSSTSWRATRPLRELKDAGLRVRDRALNRAPLRAHLKSTIRRRAAPPLRWLIARRRLRALVDSFLPRFPALERRVRTSVQRVTAHAAGAPRGPNDISLAARAVLRELIAARRRADPRGGG